MITLFGLSAVATIAILVGCGLWLLLGVPFAVNGCLEKKKKYVSGQYAGGFFSKMFSYSFAVTMSLLFSPVLLVFWLGKRSGKKSTSG